MSRTLKDDMIEEFATGVCDTMEFAERVVYLPRSGNPREFDALVNRSPETRLIGPRDGGHRSITVSAANDPVAGINPNTIDTGGDRIRLAETIGGPLVDLQVFKLLGVSHSRLVVELR